MQASRSTRLHQEGVRRSRTIVRSLGESFRSAREDAGVSQRQVAAAAGVSQSLLSAIEAGNVEPSLTTIASIALALGGEASLRFFPGTGSRLRDRVQAPMAEIFLRGLSPRWSRFPEVVVHRPVSGVIDLVLADRQTPRLVAIEFHSQLRRLEQQIRWARAKADALPSATIGGIGGLAQEGVSISRVLVLRSTSELRRLAVDFEATLAAAYPARARDLHAALAGSGGWPGDGILWMVVDGRQTRLMRDPPRGVRLGRCPRDNARPADIAGLA